MLTKALINAKLQSEGLEAGLGTLRRLNNPRFTGDIKPHGILDVSVEDITIDAPNAVKMNILVACNECSLAGYTNGKEYATLLDAETGEAVSGCKLKEGTKTTVSIADWLHGVIDVSQPSTLILTHNHTNASMLSFEDIRVLFEHTALHSVMACSGERIYAISRLEGAVNDYSAFFEKVHKAVYNSNVLSGGTVDEDKLFKVFVNVLAEFNISYERW